DLWFPSHEVLEQLERVGTTAPGEYPLQETPTGFGIKDAAGRKCGEHIRREHFGPFVAVITGGISSRKYVGEAVLEAIELRNRIHRCECLHTPNHFKNLVHFNLSDQLVEAE